MFTLKDIFVNPKLSTQKKFKPYEELHIALGFYIFYKFTFITDPSVNSDKKSKILIHITQGLENPTRAALGFLIAKTALEEGHTVSIFLAGDAVKLLQDSVLNTLSGLGTGKLRDHFESIVS